jgi:hypothetical protein
LSGHEFGNFLFEWNVAKVEATRCRALANLPLKLTNFSQRPGVYLSAFSRFATNDRRAFQPNLLFARLEILALQKSPRR